MNKIPVIKFSIIKFIYSRGEITGYDFIKHSKENGLNVSAGSIYPHLKNLESENIIEKRVEGRKKIYFLTKKGKEEFSKISENSLEIKQTVDKLSLVINCNCESLPMEFKESMKNFLYKLGGITWNNINDLKETKEKLQIILNNIDNHIKNIERGN